jgi:uncharacterized protein with von Willebrand factor type A (vWA) domain
MAVLGRGLRAEGAGTTLRDELDGAEAVMRVDRADRDEVRQALRIALRIPPPFFGTFERLFGEFWEGERGVTPVVPRRPIRPTALPRGAVLSWDPDERRLVGAEDRPRGSDRPGYSPEARLRRKAFDEDWTAAELARMERLLAHLARRLASRQSRRLVPTRGRGWTDLRRSYARALRTSGELVSLARRARAKDKPRLAFLLDTSGSMDAYSRFLLTFALAVRRAIPGASVHAFNTSLACVDESIAPGKVRLSLQRLASAVPDWSGGTRIGECLRSYCDRHLRSGHSRGTVVVVLSDGLDRGDPGVLGAAARDVSRLARKLIWLNPLKGDPRYLPEAQGMRVVLPYVDHFASAHDLESLERLLPHLAA